MSERPTTPIMTDILEEHFEELEFLWGQRRAALRSADTTPRQIADLEERLEAHVQGLLLGGDAASGLFEEGLRSDDPLVAFAAAYSLLRSGSEAATRKVLEAFLEAEGEGLDGIREALSHGPLGGIADEIGAALAHAPAPRAVAAAEALAFHARLDPVCARLGLLLGDEEPAVRRAAWRVVGWVGSKAPPERPYAEALSDADENVRAEALEAAAWTRQDWIVTHCRARARHPGTGNRSEILLLAVLGEASDLECLLAAGRAAELGPERFRILGAFGHPGVVETLLEGMESDDPLAAAAAAAAFYKITGRDVASKEKAVVPPADGGAPDAFEEEFLDEVAAADVGLARAHWQEVHEAFSSGTRWWRGRLLGEEVSAAVLRQLDLESRREACLRGAVRGSWEGRALDLEMLSQPPARSVSDS